MQSNFATRTRRTMGESGHSPDPEAETTIAPAAAGAIGNDLVRTDQAPVDRRRRSCIPAIPIRPVARSTIVAGSGTTVLGGRS